MIKRNSLLLFLKKNWELKRFIIWYFLANTLLFWIIGAVYLNDILSSATLYCNLVRCYSSVSDKAFVLFFTFVNYLSFLMFLVFIPALALLIISCLIPLRRFIWGLSIATATLLVVLLFVDSKVYQLFRFHLNSTILAMIFNRQALEFFDFSNYELFSFAGITLFIIVLQSYLAYLVWTKIILPKRLKIGKSILLFWFAGALYSYLTLLLSVERHINVFSQQAPSLPLYSQFFVKIIPTSSAATFLRYSENYFALPEYSTHKLNYPLHEMRCEKPAKPYNIILIVVDALRFDSLKREYMPSLTEFAAKSWQFKQHLSGGNSTQPGLFSLFYSLPGNYWSAVLKQKTAPLLLDLLSEYGYSQQIFWSNSMQIPAFDKTVFVKGSYANPQGAPGSDSGNKDRYITGQAIKFLSENAHKNPFFLNLFYDAPHAYCSEQSFPSPFQPADSYCSRIELTNETDPLPYLNRYLNAVLFVDSEIARVLKTIESQGYLHDSIVIITADHGQEFNDYHQNYWGHAGSFSDVQVHVPFIIHWPNKENMEINYLTSGYDLVPTLFERLFHCKNDRADYSIGQNLLVEQGRPPFVLVGSYIHMGIIEPDRITTLEVSGNIQITDKKEVPINQATPRMPVLNQALELMSRYYIDN
ncbi:Inner membrane protein YejM [Legionella massiliensis]|uniref:Inner membrane protein YejM n=1 Tax=Legionella massiliensis TaxID=1034943 RepID=A0A078KTJ7_9GAMM|nr:sulfatase-like hydrolase/transferase [Legionella massiliensis]CDZ76287.1 Inner membrane protein YejM [Legionella massiliensis]CEE12025.1 Inner membrane protein YejM [Legionella massiliensis]